MARGVPVACSDRGALAEVAGDAALRFDPESEAAIADAIAPPARRSRDGRPAGARPGPRRRSAFSWAATAAGTLAAYRAGAGAARS